MKRTFILILGLLLVACGSPEVETELETAVAPSPTDTSQPPTPESTEVAIATETVPAPESATEEVAAATSVPRKTAADYADLEIITLLPRDAIPAIDDPQFLSIEEADEAYDPDELIIGVAFNGEARAYSVPLLSNHEIVNDTVGGEKIAVTW